jgi:hypothetical protein
MKLPNGFRAQVDVKRKVLGYCLNPSHRTGRHKARIFDSVLGITASNAQILVEALFAAARNGDAKIKDRSSDAIKYEIELDVSGPSGSARVISGWIVEEGEDLPRLTTCYVKPAAKGALRGKRT